MRSSHVTDGTGGYLPRFMLADDRGLAGWLARRLCCCGSGILVLWGKIFQFNWCLVLKSDLVSIQVRSYQCSFSNHDHNNQNDNNKVIKVITMIKYDNNNNNNCSIWIAVQLIEVPPPSCVITKKYNPPFLAFLPKFWKISLTFDLSPLFPHGNIYLSLHIFPTKESHQMTFLAEVIVWQYIFFL